MVTRKWLQWRSLQMTCILPVMACSFVPSSSPFWMQDRLISSPVFGHGRPIIRSVFLRRSTSVSFGMRSEEAENSKDGLSLWETLLGRFQGDFDNYRQVVRDRSNQMLPREGGGHEHIHCTLVPILSDEQEPDYNKMHYSVLAAFYFDGLPQRIFRFRRYALTTTNASQEVQMKLYTLSPGLEQTLRAQSSNPETWNQIVASFHNSEEPHESSRVLWNELMGCDVTWTMTPNDVHLQYCANHKNSQQPSPEGLDETVVGKEHENFDPLDATHAVMTNGEALVNSTMGDPVELLIRDELSLWQDDFWINDRGYLASNKNVMVYGNWNDVPYQLERVTRWNKEATERMPINTTTTHDDLTWTLGESWRTEAEYQANLDAVGGISTQTNNK
eukprot:CAMPEP_0198285778 /NCGR_PEP_ID=MMETSP1449-20131203/5023_1 /TAXON_ID=420275 /ORGANISM="Attheya septentrionalis, Strain CCMP2084" /LENGTH=387 /DNA_ID=CAMNT_0043983333 /DNA_START=144 /DNA_END=1307 /DNA_ORIENTATION=+